MRLAGKQNYTAADLFRLSGPIFIELLLQMLVGNVDQFMVSRISQSSVAAIGNGNQLMNIVIILLSAGFEKLFLLLLDCVTRAVTGEVPQC